MTDYEISKQYEDPLPDWVHCAVAFVVCVVWPAVDALALLGVLR